MLRQFMRSLFIALPLLATSALAFAHAMLERSWPRAEETVAAAPTAIRLRYYERVEPALAQVSLANAAGAAIALGAATLASDNRRTLIIPIVGGLAPGVYTVTWRVISADGHPSEGRVRFTVGP